MLQPIEKVSGVGEWDNRQRKVKKKDPWHLV
jgi:hypothetical protein